MRVTLLAGEDALRYLEADGFEAKWKALHACCPWATGCQHPDFVMPWYRIYGKRYQPVILLGLGGNGALGGLLTLALDGAGTRLTGAGGVQAEYQGWIAAEDVADRFIQGAVERMRAVFPGAQISLKYLPPGIPVGWVEDGSRVGKWCTLQRHARPVMKIDEAAMERQRRKKNHRQNYNRLNRLGSLVFERVTEHGRFTRMFDDICRQYDFRQAALYRHMPFSSDPLKKAFYLELHRRGLLHATVLSVGDQIAASHLGLLSKERVVHLGINSHAPAFAAHSPGQLLLALLGVQLATEHVEMLDLTPGGDAYKEQFASGHDLAFELNIFTSAVSLLRAQALGAIKGASKATLRRLGWRSADVLAAVEEAKSGRWLAPHRLLDLLRLRSGSGTWVWRGRPDDLQVGPAGLPIARNSLEDVFKYDDAGAQVKLGAFIGQVMKRQEHGWQLYSFAPDDKLMIACWADCGAGNGEVVLSDLYVHRHLDDRRLVQRFVAQLLHDLDETCRGRRIVYRGEPSGNVRTVIRYCGFSEA